MSSRAVTPGVLQDSLFEGKHPFCCASAAAVRSTLAARIPPAPLFTVPQLTDDGKLAPSHRLATVSRQAEKRAAPASGKHTLHKAKKQRISSDLESSRVVLESAHGADTVVHPGMAELSSVEHQPKPRRVVPEQILPVPRPADVTSKQKPLQEDPPGGRVHGFQPRMSSIGCKGRGSGPSEGSRWQQPSCHNSPTSDAYIAAAGLGEEAEECLQAEDSSYDDSEEGSEESQEGLEEGSEDALQLEGGLGEGSEGGSEGGQPSKLIVEFGAAGDAWWHDFIAAKEEMLNDVLQANAPTCYCTMKSCTTPA